MVAAACCWQRLMTSCLQSLQMLERLWKGDWRGWKNSLQWKTGNRYKEPLLMELIKYEFREITLEHRLWINLKVCLRVYGEKSY